MLELTGRVELSVRLPSMQTSFHLHPTDSVDGEGEQPCLWDPRALGDLFWLSEVGPLELEGFLVEVELGHFGVDMLELCLEPWWWPPLPPEHLALGDSTGGLRVAALGGGPLCHLGLPDLLVGRSQQCGDLALIRGQVYPLPPKSIQFPTGV